MDFVGRGDRRTDGQTDRQAGKCTRKGTHSIDAEIG